MTAITKMTSLCGTSAIAGLLPYHNFTLKMLLGAGKKTLTKQKSSLLTPKLSTSLCAILCEEIDIYLRAFLLYLECISFLEEEYYLLELWSELATFKNESVMVILRQSCCLWTWFFCISSQSNISSVNFNNYKGVLRSKGVRSTVTMAVFKISWFSLTLFRSWSWSCSIDPRWEFKLTWRASWLAQDVARIRMVRAKEWKSIVAFVF